VWADVLARSGLDCAEGDPACASDPSICEARGGTYLGAEWARCPLREAMADPYVQGVAQLEASSKLAPLSGWPDTFAAWVPAVWSQLRAMMADRQAHAMEQGTRHGG